MENKTFALKGNIVYTKDKNELCINEQSYLVCENGKVRGIYKELPDELKNVPVEDMGDQLIIPGLTDLHVHAPQYSFRGLGMDMELLDWLETNTFPEEAKYKDLEYAKKAYGIFAEQMRKSAATRACIFATIHKEATREWLKMVADKNYDHTRPILTPRFTPSCTDELMERLKGIQKDFDLPMQSHLSENPGEIAWVKELCPWSEFYGDAYDHFGLFGGECPTIMAHCVYSGEEEIARMKERGVFIAHCPDSNTNLSSGVAPVRRYLEEGMNIGLGSDVAGGTSENLFAAMAQSIQASKLRWRLLDASLKPLTIEEAFYMATKGGGAFFGKVGSFEPGYEFDAVVCDDSRLEHPQPLTVKQRLERIIYLGDEREVAGKYVEGRKLF